MNQGEKSIYIGNRYVSAQDVEPKNLKFHINPVYPTTNINYEQSFIPSEVCAFTDGSKTEDGVGMGVIVYRGSTPVWIEVCRLHTYNTVFQAEALAILKTISWFRDSNYNTIDIYSDSQSSVTATAVLYPKSPLILEIQNICNMMPEKTINLYWIKAHVGFFGNEVADTLAGAAHEIAICTENIKIPKSYLKINLKQEIMSKWQRDWDSDEKGRFTYDICTKVSLDMPFRNPILIYFATVRVFDPAGSPGLALPAVVSMDGGLDLLHPFNIYPIGCKSACGSAGCTAPAVPIYYLAKPQPRERTWKNQRGKKTLLSLTLV
ncbi:hypothetical protein JTE90_007575 [Oedothorax gibbosus]|uniref:ribonuclease H n=1 Tax=Oedothorax gibbosus TaxID=931172 RepID=A0AAV6TDV1_9ARAC|nr:hypothetical protein JTE90_007575 [Oedothorax gibbosus]